MQIVRSKEYINTLKNIISYISKDSKKRALVFKKELDKNIDNLVYMPYKCRQSIYFDDENIRDLVFKGYVIPYFIDKNRILILGIIKYKQYLS